jgi:acyl-CoA thioester hydrolase
MDNLYSQLYTVRWSDLDANGHMKNTAYMECALQVRLAFFAENGFPFTEFQRQQFGPVMFREEMTYFKEIQMLEMIRATFHCSKLNDDGRRFTVVNMIFREGNVKAAEVISDGAWFDLRTRKLITPPAKLHELLRMIYLPNPADE